MTRNKDAVLSPPGETIADILEERGKSLAEFGMQMGLDERHVDALISGAALITPKVALKLETVLGSTVGFWLNREALYRGNISIEVSPDAMKQLLRMYETYGGPATFECFAGKIFILGVKVRDLVGEM